MLLLGKEGRFLHLSEGRGDFFNTLIYKNKAEKETPPPSPHGFYDVYLGATHRADQ